MQTPKEVVALSATQYWVKTKEITIQKAKVIWDWYYNDEDMISKYILDALTVIFPKTAASMKAKVLNIVPRVIDKLAFVYKENPDRMLNGGKTSKVENGETIPTENKDDDRYQVLLKKSTIEKKQGAWNALGKAFNTVLVQPVWVEDEKEKTKSYMDFLIHTPAWCSVETTKKDWLKPKSFAYDVWMQLKPNEPEEQVTVYWSDTEHYLIDANGNKISVAGNPERKNPYEILPVVVLRFKDGIDFWGEGQWDLVNGNQEICEEVTNLAYVAKTQMHGQMVVLDPTSSVKGDLLTGVDHPIHIHNYENSQHEPDAKYINARAELTPVRELVDWWIKAVQAVKGLTPQQYSLESKVISGVSKEQDAGEVEEERQRDQNILQMFESDLFDVMRIVYNVHNSNNQISTNAVFSIKFKKPKLVESQTDKNNRMKFDLDNYLASYIDLIKERNPGLSDTEAMEKFEKIVSENRKIKDITGMSDTLNKLLDEKPKEPVIADTQE